MCKVSTQMVESVGREMSEKLKSCPFCGGEAEMCRNFGRIGVGCKECNASFRSEQICSESGYDSVVKAWNRRVK